MQQYFALSHAHSRTDGPVVTVTYTGQNLKSNTFQHGLKKYFFEYRMQWWLRGKNYENIYIFYSCLEWCANYLWLWMQTCDLLRFNYSTIIILFLTSYFIVSKWWPISQWNKSYFFSTSKFRQWLDSEGDVVTFRSWHDAFYCLTHEWRITSCDLNQTRFQNGRRLSVKKKL